MFVYVQPTRHYRNGTAVSPRLRGVLFTTRDGSRKVVPYENGCSFLEAVYVAPDTEGGPAVIRFANVN